MRACVLIPVYNHATTVGRVVRAAAEHLAPVLVVDDGSTDGSGEAAAAAGASVLTHRRNEGKGAALLTGLRRARALGHTHVVTLDADAQHDPADIPALLAAAAKEPRAIVVGKREMEGSGAPSANRIGRHISNFWVALEGLVRPGDAQCGYRVYPAAPVLDLPLRSRGYEMEIEVLVEAGRHGLPVRSVPVRVAYAPPEGRITHFDLWRDNLRLSRLNARLTLTLLPALPALLARRLTGEQALELGYQVTRLVGVELSRYMVLGPTVGFFFLRASTQRRSLLAYARRLRPGAPPWEHWRLTWLILFRFAESLLERLLREKGGWSRPWDRSGEAGVERLRQAKAAGRGVILVTAHVGRWAEAAEVLQEAGLDPVLVMNRQEADAFTRALEREGRSGPRIVEASGGVGSSLTLLRLLRRGEMIAIMGDRAAGDQHLTADFLGAPVRLPVGPFLLAAAAGAPWFAIGAFAEPDGTFQTLVEGPFAADAKRREERRAVATREARRFLALLEGWIRRHPDQWFNWTDPWKEAANDISL